MKGRDFLDRLETLDAELIEEGAAPKKGGAKRRIFIRVACAAASLALVLGAAVLLLPRSAVPAPDVPSAADAGEGVYIERIELANETDGTSFDMFGLIVYKGSLYTQAEYINCSDEQKDKYAGEYLGIAKGNIDEWSTQDEYATEFASNVTGEVYAVNGYDPSFRICIKSMYDGCEFIAFFENLNGITLRSGAELYGERMHLAENYETVYYQLHDDWNWSVESYHPLDVPQETLDAFLSELYSAPFVDLGREGGYIYETEQTHLWFGMKDGTTVGLRLFKGGYVRYQLLGMGNVFVKMPGEAFDAVFDACK